MQGPLVEAPRPRSGGELKRLLGFDRAGEPYLVVRDGCDEQREIALAGRQRLVVGRDQQCELVLGWDGAVSQLHAELVRLAGAWMILDDGLSTNGSYVNGERVHGRRRLRDGDVLAFGATAVLFRSPHDAQRIKTSAVAGDQPPETVSPAQRRVLVELCRPLADGTFGAVPATNREIAAALVLSGDAIKSHMRALFGSFAIGDLPQNAKRARLADLALRTGAVAPRELRGPEPHESSRGPRAAHGDR